MTHLFSELQIRGVTLPNRIGVSPMCQYSSTNGVVGDWHFVHLGSRAVGGAGLIICEAAAVTPEGRISPQDVGAWSEATLAPFARLNAFIVEQGAVPCIQLAHAGRKASSYCPWLGSGTVKPADGGWQTLGPSAIPFGNYDPPREMTVGEIEAVQKAFVTAAERALAVGFRVIELHAAHGYLLHEFLSPLSNKRTDLYGGSFENRTRFLRDTAAALRRALPESCPLMVRISCTDWVDGGWDIEQSVELARALKDLGVDLIDCSSGGNLEKAPIPTGPGYQTGFAARIRREAGIATAAVGLITSAIQADHVIRTGQADMVLLARELLRNPYWPLHAAHELGVRAAWPAQYLRAAPVGSSARQPLAD